MTTKAKTKHNGGTHAAQATAKAKEPKNINATEWVSQMIESLTDAQKRWIDLASEQNALFLKAITEGVNYYKSAPTPALADWVKQGMQGMIEAQKRWADSTSKRTGEFDFDDLTRAVSDFTSHGFEAFVKARKQWLDFVADQNAMALNTLKENLDLEGNSSATALADFAQQAVKNYTEVQKRWLELATKLPFLRPVEKQ